MERDALSILACAAALVVTACESEDSKSVAGDNGSIPSGTGGAGGSGGQPGGGKCNTAERPLFTARAFGDNGDVVGHLEFDAKSGDLYLSADKELHVLRKGAQEPALFATRPPDVWNAFWLEDDQFLFPRGFLVPLVDEAQTVLFTMPRSGGDATVLVPAPKNEDPEYRYTIGQVVVTGDDVFWIATDGHTDNIARIPPIYDDTYFIRRTSWRSPGTPADVYSTKQELSNLIVAGGYVFVDRELPNRDAGVTGGDAEQIILDRSTGTPLSESTSQRYKGEVIYASDDALIVTRVDVENVENLGTFYLAPDGSGETKLGNTLILSIGTPLVTHEGSEFALASTINDPSDPLNSDMHVFTFSKAAGLREIGCFDGSGTEHAIEIAGDQVLVSVRRNDTNTVLAFNR